MVVLAKRGVECDVNTIVKDADRVLTGLFSVLPELKDQPGCKPWEPGFRQAQGTENGGQGDIMSRVEGKDLFFPALCGTLHPADRLIQDGVGAQERIAQVQFLLPPLSLVLYLVRLDHLEVLHVDAAISRARETDIMAEVAQHGVYGVGSPELLGGDVHDLGHVLIGPLQLAVFQT